MYCENCGAILTGGGKFCPECGAPVTIAVQNKYKKELEQGGQAFAYLPDEEPIQKTAGTADSASNTAYGYSQYTAREDTSAKAYDVQSSRVPNYGYSDETIKAAEDELNRTSKAAAPEPDQADWRNRVDSDRFRRQNAQSTNDWQSQASYDTRTGANNWQSQAPYGSRMNSFDIEYSDKSYIVAALLAFFLGGLGIHNFYLGYTKKAIIQLVLGCLTIFTIGLTGAVSGIWAFVEFIMLLTGAIKTDGEGRPLKR